MRSGSGALSTRGTNLRMAKWQKVSATVSKFNAAYFPHITGCFHLQIYALFSMTSVTQFYGFCKHGNVTFAGKACPGTFRFHRFVMH